MTKKHNGAYELKRSSQASASLPGMHSGARVQGNHQPGWDARSASALGPHAGRDRSPRRGSRRDLSERRIHPTQGRIRPRAINSHSGVATQWAKQNTALARSPSRAFAASRNRKPFAWLGKTLSSLASTAKENPVSSRRSAGDYLAHRPGSRTLSFATITTRQ